MSTLIGNKCEGANPKKGGTLQEGNPCQTCEELASVSGSFVHVFAVLMFSLRSL
jgi:hypothetical protein